MSAVKALSVRQPWAWAILHAGKRVENREWNARPSYRGPLLLHAASGCGREEYLQAATSIRQVSGLQVPTLGELPRGGFVGRVRLVEVVANGTRPTNPWAIPGQLGLVLEDPTPLPFVAAKGRLGLFEVGPSELPPGYAPEHEGARPNHFEALAARAQAARATPQEPGPCGDGTPPCRRPAAPRPNPLGLCAEHLGRYRRVVAAAWRAARAGDVAEDTGARRRSPEGVQEAMTCPRCGPAIGLMGADLSIRCSVVVEHWERVGEREWKRAVERPGCGERLYLCGGCGVREARAEAGRASCPRCAKAWAVEREEWSERS